MIATEISWIFTSTSSLPHLWNPDRVTLLLRQSLHRTKEIMLNQLAVIKNTIWCKIYGKYWRHAVFKSHYLCWKTLELESFGITNQNQ